MSDQDEDQRGYAPLYPDPRQLLSMLSGELGHVGGVKVSTNQEILIETMDVTERLLAQSIGATVTYEVQPAPYNDHFGGVYLLDCGYAEARIDLPHLKDTLRTVYLRISGEVYSDGFFDTDVKTLFGVRWYPCTDEQRRLLGELLDVSAGICPIMVLGVQEQDKLPASMCKTLSDYALYCAADALGDEKTSDEESGK